MRMFERCTTTWRDFTEEIPLEGSTILMKRKDLSVHYAGRHIYKNRIVMSADGEHPIGHYTHYRTTHVWCYLTDIVSDEPDGKGL